MAGGAIVSNLETALVCLAHISRVETQDPAHTYNLLGHGNQSACEKGGSCDLDEGTPDCLRRGRTASCRAPRSTRILPGRGRASATRRSPTTSSTTCGWSSVWSWTTSSPLGALW